MLASSNLQTHSLTAELHDAFTQEVNRHDSQVQLETLPCKGGPMQMSGA